MTNTTLRDWGDNERALGNSVEEEVQDLMDDLQCLIENRRSTDGHTFSLLVNDTLKRGTQSVRALIGDSGLDKRFKRRTK